MNFDIFSHDREKFSKFQNFTFFFGVKSEIHLFCVGDANKRTLKNEKRSNLKLMNEVSNNWHSDKDRHIS